MSSASIARWSAAIAAATALTLGSACASDNVTSQPTTTVASMSATVEGQDRGGDVDPPGTEPRRTTTTDDGPAGGATRDDYVDALLASLEAEDDVLPRDVAACVAPLWIDAIGVETLEDALITPEDLETGTDELGDLEYPRSTAEAMVDAFETCDMPLTEVIVAALPAEAREDPAVADCVEGAVEEDLLREALIAELTGEDTSDYDDQIQSAIEPCVPETESVDDVAVPGDGG